jgi:hypothetical protein
MFTMGSATSEKVPDKDRPEVTEKTLTEKLAETLWRVLNRQEVAENERMEARRYQDPRDRDPDYGDKLRALEGQIADIARDHEPGFRMSGNYSEGGDKKSWKDWMLIIMQLLIVGWVSRISLQLDDLADLKAAQKQMERRQDQTDKHLESTDSHVDRVEARVYRGSP